MVLVIVQVIFSEGEVMDKELFDKGLKIRREVLGTVYVDASVRHGSTHLAK